MQIVEKYRIWTFGDDAIAYMAARLHALATNVCKHAKLGDVASKRNRVCSDGETFPLPIL